MKCTVEGQLCYGESGSYGSQCCLMEVNSACELVRVMLMFVESFERESLVSKVSKRGQTF
jgi:hypothetical protein